MSDSYLVLYRGTRATVRLRQSNLENYVSEIDVIPNDQEQLSAFTVALKSKLKNLSGVYPNLSFRTSGRSIRVMIPDDLRVRSGSTFGQLVERFLKYVQNPQDFPVGSRPICLQSTTSPLPRFG